MIPHGAAAGLRFNAADANLGYALGSTEALVQEALRRLLGPGDVVYDIGANVGFFAVLAACLVGSSGAVVAFEPLPSTAVALRRNAAPNGFAHVTVVALAVGRATGAAKLALRKESTGARLAAPGETGPTVDVEVVAIDDLVGSGAIRPPAPGSIDVQGAELEAIVGMRLTGAANTSPEPLPLPAVRF